MYIKNAEGEERWHDVKGGMEGEKGRALGLRKCRRRE